MCPCVCLCYLCVSGVCLCMCPFTEVYVRVYHWVGCVHVRKSAYEVCVCPRVCMRVRRVRVWVCTCMSVSEKVV